MGWGGVCGNGWTPDLTGALWTHEETRPAPVALGSVVEVPEGDRPSSFSWPERGRARASFSFVHPLALSPAPVGGRHRGHATRSVMVREVLEGGEGGMGPKRLCTKNGPIRFSRL